MSKLQWSDALSLDLPMMDATHREFVDLLATVADAPDGDLVAAWVRLIDHTDAHFAQEDRWMAQTRFASGNCHATQHDVVLTVLREGLSAGAAGQLEAIRQLARELAAWFPQHAQTMDAALALHLRNVGFDPVTGAVAHHERLPAQAITGCGGSCG
ncbi:MAG: hemerythrin domain-containing protein [Burkholderiaceae bacterium]